MQGVALVTGGAKRIGRAIVERLAQENYAVAIHYRNAEEEAKQLAATLLDSGRKSMIIKAELADSNAVGTLISSVAATLGPVTLLVNSASIFEPDDVRELQPERWDETFAVNLRAPALLARDMANKLPADMQGAVINILDQRVLRPNPQFFSYTLTKSALAVATRTMAQALAPRIRVNGVAPGPTCASYRQSPQDFAQQSAATLLGKGPDPEEVAEAVVYLTKAQSITGQVLAVDAGQNLLWRTADIEGISE